MTAPKGTEAEGHKPGFACVGAGAEISRLKAELEYLKEVLEDKRRLTRLLDVAMNGEEGAANQAALCDLIGSARQLKAEIARQKERMKAIEKLATEVERCQPAILKMIRRENFVFDNRGCRWEKLAFSLYVEICNLSQMAREALAAPSRNEEGKQK